MSRDTLTKSADDLRSDLEQLRDDVGVLMKSMSRLADNGQREGLARIVEAGSTIRDQVKQAGTAARDQATESIEIAEKKIVDNPFSSVLIAFGTGLLLGKIFGRH